MKTRKRLNEAYTLYDEDDGVWDEYESMDELKADLADISMNTDDWEVEDPNGNRTPVYSLDEGKAMKVSGKQLRRIIREEKRKLLEQGHYGMRDPRDRIDNPEWYGDADDMPDVEGAEDLYINLTDEQETALSTLEQALSSCLDAGCKPADILDTVSSMVGDGAKLAGIPGPGARS